jgi:hypothetical protein
MAQLSKNRVKLYNDIMHAFHKLAQAYVRHDRALFDEAVEDIRQAVKKDDEE